MWAVSRKSAFSLTRFLKHVQCIRLCAVSTAVNFKLNSSDSDIDRFDSCGEFRMQNNDFLIGLSSNEVVETLNSLRGQPSEAWVYFKWLRGSSFSLDLSSYVAIVRVLCYCGWSRRLEDVLIEIVRNESELGFEVEDLFEAFEGEVNVLVRLCDTLVKVYVCMEMFDEAIDVLFGMERRGCDLSILSCNFFINRLIEGGKVDMALSMYQQLKRLGFRLNDYTYVLAIKAYCRKGSLVEAVDVFEEMQQVGVNPSAFAYSTFIEGLCLNGRVDNGYHMIKKWQEAGAPLSSFAYAVVIRGLCGENRLEEAEGLLRFMEIYKVPPDVHVYSALINGSCKLGYMEKALELMDEMQSKGIKMNCVIISFILKCLCNQGLASQAIDEFMKLKESQVFLDKVCYNIALEALCTLGKVQTAGELFGEMKNKKMDIDVVNYTTLIYGYCREGNISNANKLFLEMKSMGHEPDKLTHRIIIEGFCMGGKVKEAEAFFGSFPEQRLENCSAMFNGYCKANEWPRALQLFLNLYKQGMLAIESCKDSNNLNVEDDSEKAVRLHEIMVNKLIEALCQAGEVKKAAIVFDTLIRIGFHGVRTYTIMIDSLCKIHHLREAHSLFNDMKRRGITPDVVTYTVLINAYLKVNLENHSPNSDTVDASVFLREMEERNIKPDLVCYSALMARYSKTKNPQVAIDIYNEIIDRGLKPDTVTYTTAFSSYCAMGDMDRAKNLLDEMSARGIQPDEQTMASFHRDMLKVINLHQPTNDDSKDR